MKDMPFVIENDLRRVLLHPRNNGEVMACFLDKSTDIHRHKIFKTIKHARAMGIEWCGISSGEILFPLSIEKI